jgi:hypothetical protein
MNDHMGLDNFIDEIAAAVPHEGRAAVMAEVAATAASSPS